MIEISKDFEFDLQYDLRKIGEPEKILFFDIETTGLSAYSSVLYLIGTGYFSNGKFHFRQWLSESLRDEADMLKAFFRYAASFDTLLHFNGETFDIRYLEDVAKQYSIPCPLCDMDSFDILKKIRKRKELFGLENYRQKTVEKFLGIQREDRYSGGELISVYEDFTETKDENEKRFLLLHNEDDLKGMPSILPVLLYLDAVDTDESEIMLTDCYFNRPANRLTAVMKFPYAFPKELQFDTEEGISLDFKDHEIVFEITAYTGTLKFFYPNYRDYYYLPKEDTAIHRKLAAFVEKEFRQPAKAETCYTKAEGSFLPALKGTSLPVFCTELKADKKYVSYSENMLKPYLLDVMKNI